MTFVRGFILGAVIVAVGGTLACAAEPPIIAKARSHLGTEAALERIVTLHFSGVVTVSDPNDAKKQTRQAVEVVLQKPDRERVTVTSDEFIDVTALSGYEAWHRISSRKDSTKWQQDLLAAAGVKKLRAQVIEAVNFFRGCEKAGGSVRDEGTVTKQGIKCRKVVFSYAPDIYFTRYFDEETGRLVLTETPLSAQTEQGELLVQGVRLPKTSVQVSVLPDGKTQTIVTTYEKVTINEVFPPSYFDVPPIPHR